MRWYGAFRNDGEYNSEGLLNIRQLLRPMNVVDQELRKVCSKFPTAEQLRKNKMSELKKKKIVARANTTTIFGNKMDQKEEGDKLNDQLFGASDGHEFFLLMLEPGSCLLRPRNYINATAQKLTLILLSQRNKEAKAMDNSHNKSPQSDKAKELDIYEKAM